LKLWKISYAVILIASFSIAAFARATAGQGSVRDSRSAISNRLAGAPPLVQNTNLVENYLRLFGNKIERRNFGSEADGGLLLIREFGRAHSRWLCDKLSREFFDGVTLH
jgi:hypothetical protein